MTEALKTNRLVQAKREIAEELFELRPRPITGAEKDARIYDALIAERARNLELQHDYALEVKAKTAANEENRRLQSEVRRLHETVTQLKVRLSHERD